MSGFKKQEDSSASLSDFAQLLEMIKNNELRMSKYPITANKLKFFSTDRRGFCRYHYFKIRKKNGGYREIQSPCNQLNILLLACNELFRKIYSPAEAAMGFVKGRSIVDNAMKHTGHNYVFNVDLQDFFSTITQPRVWKRLQLPPFNFSIEIANVLAGLCCSYNEKVEKNVLPQGFPTSPLLSNAICDTLDRRLNGLSKRFGCFYSRYADDITFSSMHNVYNENGEFRQELERIIKGQGFIINESKTRLQRDNERQEVTGLIVNKKINVSRKYISDLRWILNLWETQGYDKAYAAFYIKYKSEKGHIKKGEPILENVLRGKINFLTMVRGNNDMKCKTLQDRFDALIEKTNDKTIKSGDKTEKINTRFEQPKDVAVKSIDKTAKKSTPQQAPYICVISYSVGEFQQQFNTKISFAFSQKGKLYGKCIIKGCPEFIPISNSLKSKILTEIMVNPSMASELVKKYYVTLCRRKYKNFWLLTENKKKRSERIIGKLVTPVRKDKNSIASMFGDTLE